MKDSLNFVKPYLRGWPIIIGAMVLAFLVASRYLQYVTPMYESTAKLRLADLTEGVPNSNLFKDLDVFASSQKINAEIELLKSFALISKALEKVPFEVQVFRSGSIRKTELFHDSPVIITPLQWSEKLKDVTFRLSIGENRNLTIRDEKDNVYQGYLGDTVLIENSLAVIQLNEALLQEKKYLKIEDDYLFTVNSLSKQISLINSGIDIMAVDKDIPVIRISFKSSHPGKAVLFPNALAEAYIEDYIENKYGAANVTVEFLNDRISEISRKLVESEQMILNYRDNKSITNIRQETETDMRQISQLKIQQTNLKMTLEAVRDLENYIQSGKENFLDLAPNFEAFTDLLSTEIIKNIKQLQAEKKDLLLVYTEKDEKVIVVDAKIKDLTSYLVESITNTRKNLQTKYEKLSFDISESEKVFIDVPEKERMMTILNREFEIFQQSYNFLNQKKIEAEIAKAAKIAFHRIITPATVSKEPVSPNRVIIKAVSAILGMMGAIILIFLVHTLKGRVNDQASVESNSMIPIVAMVPKLKTDNEKEQFFLKTLAEWEVKEILKNNQISCFTGFDHSQGVDFLAKEMANAAWRQNRKVLLLEILNQDIETGSDFYQEKIINKNTIKGVVSASQLKTITTKVWQEFLQEKATEYDQTIIINTDFGQPYTLATMAASGLNIVCLDTRLTPAKLITEVDLIKEEYKLPQVFLAINRVGYNPSFIRESIQFIKKGMITLKGKR
ncbi:GumC family protein [Aquiflexum lacus]|uniref:GumC family protein n=1 Tax=Aquiflexum lacus TaxID=2483805 RepID=UPI001893171D|nr:GNVR domain-containing protein [Aquiflexum lacus]